MLFHRPSGCAGISAALFESSRGRALAAAAQCPVRGRTLRPRRCSCRPGGGAGKERYAQASLYLLLPYHPAERPLPLPTGFDGTLYPEGMESVPKRLAISRANRWMVGHSDYLIAWAWRPGNARSVLDAGEKRARQGLLHIIRLPREGGSTQ